MADERGRLTAALADRYSIQRELGRGGMATVYLADDLKLERHVAVKVVKPDLAAILGKERFLREVKITAKLEHPHILGLHDSGEAEGFLYYVMQYVEGESLRDRLDREKQLPLDDALQIAREVADALSYAHSHDVIHRDIKPENILLKAGHAVVADFGIARAISAAGGDRLTETGLAIGTPTYMSPEQATGEKDLDGRSDLYSLGCVLYEMLAGRAPFTGPAASVIHQHLTAEPPAITNIRPAVPAEVAAALSRALAKTPADRFSPVAQFADALLLQRTRTEPAPAAPKSGWWKPLLSVASVVIVLGGGWFAYRASLDSETAPVEAAFRPFVIVTAVEGSADAATREAVGSLFAIGLEGSGAVRPLTEGQIRQALQAAGRADTTPLDVDIASELAVRGGFRPVIVPTVERVGDTYVLAARVLDARDEAVMASARAEASGEDEVIDATDEVVRQVSVSLGGSSERLGGFRLSQIATPSLEALQLLRGTDVGSGDAVYSVLAERLHKALRLDPGFAMAWRRLGMAHRNAGYTDSARAALTEALRHEERLTPEQRLEAEGALAIFDWDIPSAFRAYDRLRTQHGLPDDNLSFVLRWLGRWDEALDLMNDIIARSPYGPELRALGVRDDVLIGLGRVDEARASHPSPTRYQSTRYLLMSARWSAVDSAAAALESDATGTVVGRGRATLVRASAFAAAGRVRAAEEALDRLTSAASAQGLAPRLLRNYETARLLFGMTSDRPLRGAGGSVGDTSPAAWTHHALQAALTGDTATAKALLLRVAGLPKEDRGVLGAAPRVAEAAIAAAGNRWDAVSPLVGGAAGWVWPERTYGIGLDYAGVCRLLLAVAHERLGQLDSAVVYLRLLATPVEMYKADEGPGAGLTYSFAHFRLGKLYSQLEQYDRAKEHYLTFLEAFTQPDPEYEWMVNEARAKLEELARGR